MVASAASSEGSADEHFGTMLRRLRRRVPQSATEEDRRRLDSHVMTVREVCSALHERGFRISAREYRDIEAGASLPANCAHFLDSIAECLSLSDEETEHLTLLLARDILRDVLGDELVDELLGPEPEAIPPTWL